MKQKYGAITMLDFPVAPAPTADPSSYPKNPDLAQYLTNCIESFKEMADYGGKAGVKVTLENHWGRQRTPSTLRSLSKISTIPSAKRHPTSVTGNTSTFFFTDCRIWRLMRTRTCMRNYWNRWKDPDVQRNVRIMLNSGYTGLCSRWNMRKGLGMVWKGRTICTMRCWRRCKWILRFGDRATAA
jgi:hypothetical protein